MSVPPAAPLAAAPLAAARRAVDQAVGTLPGAAPAAAVAKALLAGYHARWYHGGWRVLDVGREFYGPLVNPDSGRSSRSFQLACRADGLIASASGPLLLEHRTTSADIEKVDAPYWQQIRLDAKLAVTAIACRRAGLDVRGVVVDVVRRADLRPRRIPAGSSSGDEPQAGTQREIRDRGTYFGRPLVELPDGLSVPDDGRETPPLFAQRLAVDTLQRPERYFQRRLMPLGDERCRQAAVELWQTAVEIRRARRRSVHFRNPDACLHHHVPCEFLPLCAGEDVLPDSRWSRRPAIHPQLHAIPPGADLRQLLTPRRTQCFRQCRRKHFYQYELGVGWGRPATGAAARFGWLFHEALAAWWRAMGPEAH